MSEEESAYQRAKERHERRNELLMAYEKDIYRMKDGQHMFCPDQTVLDATDLRIIADELDRRNGVAK